MNHLKIKALGILFCLFTLHANAQIEPQFEKDIRKLIELSGSVGSAGQLMDRMIENYKKILPDVPDAFWAGIREEISAEALVDKIVPIYARHYTHDDIKQLIAFYESPIGKKLQEKTPIITQESMQVGEAWGREIAIMIQARLEAEEE
jgi:hypothetical protein